MRVAKFDKIAVKDMSQVTQIVSFLLERGLRFRHLDFLRTWFKFDKDSDRVTCNAPVPIDPQGLAFDAARAAGASGRVVRPLHEFALAFEAFKPLSHLFSFYRVLHERSKYGTGQ
jgi:hypothetical protein